MKALLDADIYVFRAAAASENDDLFVACSRVDDLINNTLNELEVDKYELFLTGKDNFRYSIFPEYKANRYGKSRPKWEQAVKRHIIDQWDGVVCDGMEADDRLGISQTDSSIICSIDKDLNQIPGWHYNFVKHEKYFITPEEADRYFWYQLLVGDPTDGIKGASGIGKVKAERILDGLSTNQERYQACLELFSCEEELDLNAQCVYIHRKENDSWRNLIVSKGCCYNPTKDSKGNIECCQGINI